MTLLQTRVEDSVARRFARAAKARGLSPYEWLQQLVRKATAEMPAEGWETHWDKIAALSNNPLPYGTVARDREKAGER